MLAAIKARLREAQEETGLDIGATPHGPRAGYASESVCLGRPFVETREGGRWLSDSSLRIYLDVVAAADIATQCEVQGHAAAMAWAIQNFVSYFPMWLFDGSRGNYL